MSKRDMVFTVLLCGRVSYQRNIQRRQCKVRDFFRKLATVWAAVTILLFIAVAVLVEPKPRHDPNTYAILFIFLLISAVTGAGWLWHYFGGSK